MMIPEITEADVILVSDYEDMPKGSRFDGKLVNIQGAPYWEGMWGSRAGTYHVSVPAVHCEVYDEKEHNPGMFFAKKVLEESKEREIERMERAQLAYLKEKYEK